MRLVHPLLLSVVASSAIVSAELGIHDSGEINLSRQDEQEGEGKDFVAALTASLNEHIQLSGDFLQRFFGAEKHQNDVLRVFVIDEDSKMSNSTDDRKRACMKAVQNIHEQDQLQTETKTLLDIFRPVLGVISLRIWGESSCDDLELVDLVMQCKSIVDAKDTVKKLLMMDKTDDEVCEVMQIVSDLENANNLSCKLCERFVDMVDQALSQEVQQVQQVRAIIGDLCDAMSADSQCHTFLKNYDEVVDMLKHDTDPLVICTRIAMCPSVSDTDSLALNTFLSSPDSLMVEDNSLVVIDSANIDTSCVFCSHVAGVIYHVNEVFPEQLPIVKSVLGMMCVTALSESKCGEVEEKFDQIVELVQLNRYPRDICADLSFCHVDILNDILSSNPTIRNEKSCVYCDAATTVVEVVLQEAPDQIEQIRDYADIICGMLGEESPCHQYVNQLDIVIDSLKKGVHPRAICKTLSYCPSEIADHTSDFDAISRLDVMRMVGLEANKNWAMLNGDVYLPHDSCFFCSRVAEVIHHLNFASPGKLPNFKNILSNVCTLVPSRYNCDFFDMQFDKIAEMVNGGMRSFESCEVLNVCNKNQRWDDAAPFIAYEIEGAVTASLWHPGNTTQCKYCQFATTAMKIALQQYGTDIREVRAYADMICDMLGSDNPCHVYMKEFDFVIDGITKGMSSKAICTELKFCATQGPNSANSDVSAFDLVLTQVAASTDGCVLCKQVASVIAETVEHDLRALTLFRRNANTVCGMYPNTNKCHSFVKQLDVMLDALQKGVPPESMCTTLKICSKDNELAKIEQSVPELVAIHRGEERNNSCAACSDLILMLKYVHALKPEEKKEMREAAAILCQLLPADDTCHIDLERFDIAISDLQLGKQPEEVCRELKLCAFSKTSRDLTRDLSGKHFLPTICASCRQNTLLLKSLITRPESLAIYEREIELICQIIPQSNDCELLLQHKDMIIDSLKNGKDISAICAQTVGCDSVTEAATESNSIFVGCLFCEYAADILERAKNDDNILREAKVTLETICTVLPPLARCDVLTSKFDELVSLMREGKSPRDACHAISLCDSAFIYTSTTWDDPIVQAPEKSRQSLGEIMEIE
ncbi:Prosaposin [Plasmopara halstedii]|uniref:Prosaposin n=1 Tax=Plasmopara halstedii TaxID=4781 RepID=A0A0P1AMU5_PLAHL|nr:Prosaposin [Plasmopara halstedii]CEG42474.1 Prosaposin [Plasmopara halstedii]|eukprot:XP_024578843.1 Prosaposin [Plasmopara halstedii]